jgi:hypothetical protein
MAYILSETLFGEFSRFKITARDDGDGKVRFFVTDANLLNMDGTPRVGKQATFGPFDTNRDAENFCLGIEKKEYGHSSREGEQIDMGI